MDRWSEICYGLCWARVDFADAGREASRAASAGCAFWGFARWKDMEGELDEQLGVMS